MTATMLCGDACDLPLDDESVDCIVTSPPYNVGMPYEGVDDRRDWNIYEKFVNTAVSEMRRVLKPGGRVWINVVQSVNEGTDHGRETGRRVPLLGMWTNAVHEWLHYRDTVVWSKGIGNQATAWGSYLSPNAPNLRGRWEPVIVAAKDHWTRAREDGRNDLSAAEWTAFTNNVWAFPSDGRNRWHPAPYPRELVRRCVLLSTWPGDTVLDPFAGTGTTVTVAHELGRFGIGVDLSAEYVRRFNEVGVQEVLG